MGKAMGMMVGVFSVGGVSMALMNGQLGSFAESMALGLVGVGLVATSRLMGSRIGQVGTAPSPIARELKVN